MPIGSYDTAGDVYGKLMHLGAQVVLKTADTIATGQYELLPQDEAAVSKAPKVYKETCELSFDQPVVQVYTPGTLITDNKRYLKFACTDGYLVCTEVKMAGKKQMDVKSFLNGYTVEVEG